MKSITCNLILAVLLCAASASGETVGGVIASIHGRGLYFDQDRYDTTTLIRFINDAAPVLAALGQTNEAQAVIALGSGYRYALPADFHIAAMAVLNADPEAGSGDIPQPSMLPQVKPSEYTELWSPTTGRPRHFMVWNDSLWIDLPSYSEADTLTLLYYALPAAVSDAADTIDLPDVFIPLLRDIVVQLCLWRVEYPSQSPEDKALALTNLIREALASRENE